MAQTTGISEQRSLQLSPSVASAKDRLPDSEPIGAATVVRAILDLHRSDYAHGKASSLVLDEPGGTRRPAQKWLASVRTIFDDRTAPELHGRLVIIGLGLLEPDLRRQLQRDGFLDALMQELKEPLDELLTPEGRSLRQPADTVPNQPDDPLDDSGASG